MLNEKVIVIAGGCGLLGRAFVKSLLLNKATVIIGDIDTSASKKLSEEINMPDKLYFYKLDINDANSVEELIIKIKKKFNRIDALVNNAYPRNNGYGNHFFDVKYKDFIENLSINLGGYFLTAQKFSIFFKEQGFGNIVNIASIYGVISPKFEIYKDTKMTTPVEYSAIKAGLIHLTKYMAKYFKGLNIRVNCISPGGIKNNQDEAFLKAYHSNCLNTGMLDPDDISGTLIFLLSEKSKHINGQNIIVDDGFTL